MVTKLISLPPLSLTFSLHGPALLSLSSIVSLVRICFPFSFISINLTSLVPIIVMSAPEVVATPVVAVEEANPAETVPAPESSVPAAEVPNPEEVSQSPVRPLCLSI